MKILFNETQTTVILAGGRLELHPKGIHTKRDRLQVQDRDAELPDVVRFAQLGKIRIRTLEEAARADAADKAYEAASKGEIAARAAIAAEKAEVDARKAAEAVPPSHEEEPAPAPEKQAEKPARYAETSETEHRDTRRHRRR